MKTKNGKERAPSARERRVKKVMDKVTEMCDYAMDNLVVEPSMFEELEALLNDVVR